MTKELLCMRTIAVINQKGGVGKTTSVVNTGAGLARLDRRVLLMDLDPQAHLTYSLGVPAHELDCTLADVLAGEAVLADVLTRAGSVDLVPASMALSGADTAHAATPSRERLLSRAMQNLAGYDYVLMDCPPNLGLMTLNALAAAREVFIPLQAEYLALQSLSALLETVDAVRGRLNPDLAVTGVVCVRYARMKRLNREIWKSLMDYFGDRLFETMIRENISLAEAPSFGQDIFAYRPRSHGAQDYRNLCREIVRMEAP
jgi:chromosome partitioning protein